MSLLDSQKCIVVQEAVLSWSSDNSNVLSLPALKLMGMPKDFNVQSVGASLVTIHGPSREPLHYHVSHLYGLIIKGHGILRYHAAADFEEKQLMVGERAMVIIPRNVLHLFECEVGKSLCYLALELSDGEIDYQKHWR